MKQLLFNSELNPNSWEKLIKMYYENDLYEYS